MHATQITALLAVLAHGADRMPLPQMPGAPIFDCTNVTAFIEKYESLARSADCDVTASGHFPYYCTEDVRETVLMLPAYAYCDSEARSWPALRAEMLDAFRPLDSVAFRYTRGNLERLQRVPRPQRRLPRLPAQSRAEVVPAGLPPHQREGRCKRKRETVQVG